MQAANTFSVCTAHRGFLMQTLGAEDIWDWLYAINPLMATQMRQQQQPKTLTVVEAVAK